MNDIDNTFLTRQNKQKSSFEQKYIERFGGTKENSLTSPSMSPQLLKKKQEMEHTNSQLEEARTKFESWKTTFQRKKKELDEKQHTLDLQKSNLKTFTEHHNGELEKAKKKESDEKELAKKIEQELISLTEEEEILRKQNEDLKQELEELQPCADYLQAVADKSRSFNRIEDILNRHQSLAATRQEYIEKFQNLMLRFGSDEKNLNQELEKKKMLLIDRTMKLNEGIFKNQQAKKTNQYKKTTLVKDIQRIETKKSELAEIKSAIQTIYNRAVEKSSQIASKTTKPSSTPTIELMLQFIENRFNDLDGILSDPKAEYISPSNTLSKKLSLLSDIK